MNDTPSYYANIPAPVRYSDGLTPNAKLLYGEITALCNKEGFCWAKNEYFAGLYKKDVLTISRWISQLKKQGFIDVKIDQSAVQTRKIYLQTYIQKNQELLTKKSRAIDEKINTSIYSINNTINTMGSPLNFILKNYPIRFEHEFLIPFEKEFKNQKQFDMFLTDFNDEAEMKSREFGSWMVPMLKKYCRKWLDFQGRMKVVKNDEDSNKQANKHLDAAI